jgi:hypothetical protein
MGGCFFESSDVASLPTSYMYRLMFCKKLENIRTAEMWLKDSSF